jgi:hypothetical protein
VDIHLNTCAHCGTHNPSPPKHSPTRCSGCGERIEMFNLNTPAKSCWGSPRWFYNGNVVREKHRMAK